jgi:hypothetical protein
MKTILGLLLALVFLAAGFAMFPEIVAIMNNFYTNIALVVDPSMSSISHAVFNAGSLIVLGLIIYGAYQFYKGQTNRRVP